MKMILLITFSIFVTLFGCTFFSSQDNVKAFIPGTYISTWVSQFSEARDTILITPIVQEGSEGFLITRRTYLNFINAASNREPEYKIKHWSGSYDAGSKTIFINNDGRVLFFDPGKKEMKMGVITYKKL